MNKVFLTAVSPEYRIHAIKDLRAATGMGLREAKNAVDKIVVLGNDEVDLSEFVSILDDEHAARIYDQLYHASYIDGRLDVISDAAVSRTVAKLAIATATTVASGASFVASDLLYDQAAALDADTAIVFRQAAKLIAEVL